MLKKQNETQQSVITSSWSVCQDSQVVQRKYDIPALSHGGLHKLLFADSYLLTRSLPWHYSPVYCRTAEQLSAGLRSAAASTSSPFGLLLSASARSWICTTDSHMSPLRCRNKISPQAVYIPRSELRHAVLSALPSAPVFCHFARSLPRHLPLRSDLGKWNVVIEEKVQIGSSCKWSLVSGRRFLFRR